MQTKPRELGPEAVVARAIARFRDTAVRALPVPTQLAEELAVEAEPALRALVEATADGAEGPLDSLEHHETLAMATLLGRKLAIVGATPTAAERLMPTLLEALRSEGWSVPLGVEDSLRVLLIEGFVRGREETLIGDAARDAAARIPVVELAPRVLGVFPRGRYDAAAVTAVIEELGRRIFREEIESCLVVLEGLERPSPSVARAFFAVDESARMVGTAIVFSGVSDELRHASERAGLELTHLTIVPSAAEGLQRALGVAGLGVGASGGLVARLRGLIARA